MSPDNTLKMLLVRLRNGFHTDYYHYTTADSANAGKLLFCGTPIPL